jgi:hypothetical protein
MGCSPSRTKPSHACIFYVSVTRRALREIINPHFILIWRILDLKVSTSVNNFDEEHKQSPWVLLPLYHASS